MSSSYRYRRRQEDAEVWGSFGDWSSHYLAVNKECHPDFERHEIGCTGGIAVCVRRPKQPLCAPPKPKRENVLTCPAAKRGDGSPFGAQCFHKVVPSFDMYSLPSVDNNPRYSVGQTPRMISDPYALNDRRMPHEQERLMENMYRKQRQYNGSGIPGHQSPTMFRSGCPPKVYDELNNGPVVDEKEGPYDVTRGIQSQVYSSTRGAIPDKGAKPSLTGNYAF